MKIGSKVVCVNDTFEQWVHELYEQLPIKDHTYTVRAVSLGREKFAMVNKDGQIVKNGIGDKYGGTVRILLEEIKNGEDPMCKGQEKGFSAERFRELEEIHEDQELVAVGDEGEERESWQVP
jgi:hypothetical protein